MAYVRAIDTPPRSQWETSSGSFSASQSFNCGPACMTFIADFYRDRHYGIEATRRLVVACCEPTDITDQREMLNKRGVPAQIYNVATLTLLKSIISTGRRPVGLRVLMSRVPDSIAGHTFQGWHEIVAVANGSAGIWIMDPNLKTGAFRYYPDWLVKSAFIDPQPAYAVVPITAKYIPPPPPPAPTPTPKPAEAVADGDPYPMRFRRATANNDRFVVHTVRAGRPIRKGALTSSGSWVTPTTDTAFTSFGTIPKADLPLAEQKYGDVLLGVIYHVNGDHIGYVKAVDTK